MQSRNRLGCHRKYITGYSEIDGSDERKTATCTYIERHFGPRWQLRFSYSFTNRVLKNKPQHRYTWPNTIEGRDMS